MVWMALFGYPQMKSVLAKFKERNRSGNKRSVNDQYTDPLNVIMRSYDEVPLWWFIVLFFISFAIIITILACGYLYIPIWTYFIALLTGAVVVIVRIHMSNYCHTTNGPSLLDGSMLSRISSL